MQKNSRGAAAHLACCTHIIAVQIGGRTVKSNFPSRSPAWLMHDFGGVRLSNICLNRDDRQSASSTSIITGANTQSLVQRYFSGACKAYKCQWRKDRGGHCEPPSPRRAIGQSRRCAPVSKPNARLCDKSA